MLQTPAPSEGLNSGVCGHGDLRLTLQSICLGSLFLKSDTLGNSFSNRPHVFSDPSDVSARPLPTWTGQTSFRIQVASVMCWSELSPVHAQDGKAVLSTHIPDPSLHPPSVSSSRLPFQGQ